MTLRDKFSREMNLSSGEIFQNGPFVKLNSRKVFPNRVAAKLKSPQSFSKSGNREIKFPQNLPKLGNREIKIQNFDYFILFSFFFSFWQLHKMIFSQS